MPPTLPPEAVAAIFREAVRALVRDDRWAAVKIAASCSLAYKEVAPILYRVLHISSTRHIRFQSLFSDKTTTLMLNSAASERVCRHVKHLIVTANDWLPTRDHLASFSELQSMSGSPDCLRHILRPDWHDILPSSLQKIHIWDAVYIENLPPSITHVSVRFPRPGYMPYISGPVDLGAPLEYIAAGRNPQILRIGFEIIDRFTPGALIINEFTMRQLLARIFSTTTNMDMHVTFRAAGRAALLDSWDRYVRAVDSLSDSEKARIHAWRDERATQNFGPHFNAVYDSGLDLHLALNDAWEERDMWNSASPLTTDDFERAQELGRLNMGRPRQTARKSGGGQVPGFSVKQTARKSTSSDHTFEGPVERVPKRQTARKSADSVFFRGQVPRFSTRHTGQESTSSEAFGGHAQQFPVQQNARKKQTARKSTVSEAESSD